MNTKAYYFNRDAIYRTGALYNIIQGGDFTPYHVEWMSNEYGHRLASLPSTWLHNSELTSQEIIVRADGTSVKFKAEFLDVFRRYRLPHVTTNDARKRWDSAPMSFWQNQLNFAAWCATTGCGISLQDHIRATSPLS